MSEELIVQYGVTGLLVVAFAWFIVRQVRSWRAAPVVLHEGDEVSLVQVRRIDNGKDLHWGRANQSSGGRVTLHARELQIESGPLGVGRTQIRYQDVSELCLEPFGLIELVVLRVKGQDHYWALGIRRPKLAALLDFLAEKNLHPTAL